MNKLSIILSYNKNYLEIALVNIFFVFSHNKLRFAIYSSILCLSNYLFFAFSSIYEYCSGITIISIGNLVYFISFNFW